MLNNKKSYPFSINGLDQAIADRHTTLKIRSIVILSGVIGIGMLLCPVATATVAFTTL